jgi:serine/threonine-protein kinase
MNDDPNLPPDDANRLRLLDEFLDDLHAGRKPDRERVLAQHPELEDVLSCLESLERLVPDSVAEQEEATVYAAVTLPSQAVPSDRAAASDFGKYELLAELGRGGMGVVYKARQKDLDRIVALKMILGSQLASREEVERFHNEARAAARLRHLNIVQVYEAGEIGGQHYFAMQYIEGFGFDELLRTRPPPLEQSVRILIDVARAVAYLHEHGIVHRDLKPANIMLERTSGELAGGRGASGEDPTLLTTDASPLTPHYSPRLTDFGLAKILEGDSRLTRTGAILGTPSYMSPEQAAGGKWVGPASDIYSLGAILYEVLTGKPPFREATPLDTLVQVIEGEPTLPRQVNSGVPRELELICLKCLEKLPERRYASATELADDLEHFLNGDTVEARPQGPWQHLRRWARREPALVARLAGLALFTAIIQLNYSVNPHDRPDLHYTVLAVVGIWALLSWVCQRLLRYEAWSSIVKGVWSCSEPFLLTLLLWLTGNSASVLLVVYAILIAVAGLWFQVPIVWATTWAALAAFTLLVLASPDLHQNLHHDVIFLVFLVVLGAVVAHQVERIRILSRHYSQRPLKQPCR